MYYLPVVSFIVSFIFFRCLLHAYARAKSTIYGQEYLEATKLVRNSMKDLIWTKPFVIVINSQEIVIRHGWGVITASTAALKELTKDQLSFLIKSEANMLKILNRSYGLAPAGMMVLPMFLLLLFSKNSSIVDLMAAFIFGICGGLAALYWALEQADKCRPQADEKTVFEIAEPQVASMAVQKAIRSAIPDSKQSPYQTSMKRLEIVEDAIRRRENLLSNPFLQ